METLRNKQSRFCKVFAEFVLWIYEQGYEITDGEAWRSEDEAKRNAAQGDGIANSLHTIRLARDINLFRDGVWLTTVRDYEPLGTKWKSMGVDHRWGGDFKPRPDADHFSIEHNGVK